MERSSSFNHSECGTVDDKRLRKSALNKIRKMFQRSAIRSKDIWSCLPVARNRRKSEVEVITSLDLPPSSADVAVQCGEFPEIVGLCNMSETSDLDGSCKSCKRCDQYEQLVQDLRQEIMKELKQSIQDLVGSFQTANGIAQTTTSPTASNSQSPSLPPPPPPPMPPVAFIPQLRSPVLPKVTTTSVERTTRQAEAIPVVTVEELRSVKLRKVLSRSVEIREMDNRNTLPDLQRHGSLSCCSSLDGTLLSEERSFKAKSVGDLRPLDGSPEGRF